jgi:Protein of unknown function (DUF1214)
MKATIFLVLAVERRPEETRRSFQNLVGALEFSVLLLEISDPLRLRRGDPRGIPVVDIGLTHPGAHRLHAVSELASDPLHRPVIGAQLGTQRPHHPHRSGLLLRAVPTRRRLAWRLFLRHDSILVSKVRSLQDFQGDSKDKNGSAFDRAATYRFAVPPNVPVTLYWSATAYDRATHTSSETRPGPADPRTHPVLRPTTTDQ